MKYFNTIVLLMGFLILSSCRNDRVSFGAVEYYPGFLWQKEHSTPVEKTFDFEFSPDAKNDPNSFAEIEFVDNEGRPVDPQVLQVYVDGHPLEANRMHIDNKVSEKKVSFLFSPSAKAGKYQGYLRLSDHNLDRLNAQQLKAGDTMDILQWTLEYNKMMNPLKKILLWIGITILVLLLLWFLVFRPYWYPCFGRYRKTLLVKQNGTAVLQRSFQFKGARMVVFTSKKMKQPLLNRIFTGKIMYVQLSWFKEDLIFTPRKNGKMAMGRGKGYSVQPNPMPQNGLATVENSNLKIQINVN